MESLAPNLFVLDIQATITFYQQLGFQLVMTVPGEKEEPVWAMMANGNVTFMFQTYKSLGEELPQISRQDGGSLLLYIKLKDIRTFFKTIEGSVTILQPLHKTFYGATEFSISDNNNFVLVFAEDEGEAA
jgi:uncharacterized glyoxalase superfamily protein PhnB